MMSRNSHLKDLGEEQPEEETACFRTSGVTVLRGRAMEGVEGSPVPCLVGSWGFGVST